MPEHKKLEANGAAKIDPNDFEKAQSSEDEDPRVSNSKLYEDSINDIKAQLDNLMKQSEKLKKEYGELEQKSEKLDEGLSGMTSTAALFLQRPIAFGILVLLGGMVSTWLFVHQDSGVECKINELNQKLERNVENVRNELNQNLKDLRRDFMKCYRNKIIYDHQK